MTTTWADLVELADPGSVERGRVYARENRVRIRARSASEVLATVEGTHRYEVRLRTRASSCDCPMGRGGAFCKHCVAVALVAGDDMDDDPDGAGDPVEQWLETLDDLQLRDLVREARAASPTFEQALLAQAARSTGDLGHLERLVDQTLRVHAFLGWDDTREYARQVRALVDELEDLLSAATADRLLPLVEKAVAILYRVIERVDDSSGAVGHEVGRLHDLHVRAANLGAPDPKRLARWLLKVGIDESDLFEVDVDAYRDPLGAEGISLYRRELEKRHATGRDDFAVRRALERLAVLDHDVPRVVELVGGDLTVPYQYLLVVRTLQEMDEHDEALRLAMEGLRRPGAAHQVQHLYDATCELLTARGEADRVVTLRHEQMEAVPSESSYHALREAAQHTKEWPAERAWALEVLLRQAPSAWLSALLSDGDVDLAWEAAQSMELLPSLWHRLLVARAKDRPDLVFDGYVALVEAELEVADQGRYRQACSYLRELRAATGRSGQRPAFDELVQDLVRRHRRRPTLVTMLMRL